jgi:hypothetical protein
MFVGPSGLCCNLLLVCLLTFFCLNDISTVDCVVLKSDTIIVLGSVCTFKSSSVHLMKSGEPTLGAYILTITISA